MARQRNYKAEYEARQARAKASGFSGYGQQRGARAKAAAKLAPIVERARDRARDFAPPEPARGVERWDDLGGGGGGGLPSPDTWAKVDVVGTGDGWSVTITTDTGASVTLPNMPPEDVWEIYDEAIDWGVDVDREYSEVS